MEDATNQQTNAKLCDAGKLVLSALLLLSPWVFKYSTGAEFWNATAVGVIIAVLSIAALADSNVWAEWLSLYVSLWLVISSWALKYQQPTAMRTDVAIGILVAALAAVELWPAQPKPRTKP
jgi:hypothetical protein